MSSHHSISTSSRATEEQPPPQQQQQQQQQGKEQEIITTFSNNSTREKVRVDVIVPVHNAESTIVDTITSICKQRFPVSIEECLYATTSDYYYSFDLDVTICCHDDGSTDQSLTLLYDLQRKIEQLQQHNVRPSREAFSCSRTTTTNNAQVYVKQLLISSSSPSRGAGFARNQAASLPTAHHLQPGEYVAMLDADDIMLPTRLVEQVAYFRCHPKDIRDRTLLGCHFQRDPPDSTWHYTHWANSLSDHRLLLERFREVTILQPTWMITRRRFEALGGYVTATDGTSEIIPTTNMSSTKNGVYQLICPQDTVSTLRLAEDLRLFHAHLAFNYHYRSIQEDAGNSSHYPSIHYGDGFLKLVGSSPIEQDRTAATTTLVENINNEMFQAQEVQCVSSTIPKQQEGNTIKPLLIYRHLPGCTQSARTSRKLLLQLRVKAFDDLVLRPSTFRWDAFAIWGAGRDGKEFFKYLSPSSQVKGKMNILINPIIHGRARRFT